MTLVASADIGYGNKIALRDIPKGAQVTKYGLSIGTALADIQAGDHVHIHNGESHRGRGDKELFLSETKALMPQVSGLRRTGSACIDLAWVAAGRFDAYYEYNLQP